MEVWAHVCAWLRVLVRQAVVPGCTARGVDLPISCACQICDDVRNPPRPRSQQSPTCPDSRPGRVWLRVRCVGGMCGPLRRVTQKGGAEGWRRPSIHRERRGVRRRRRRRQ